MELIGKLLDSHGEIIGGGLELDDGRIVRVLPPADVDGWILPGLIDIHNHGGGGASFPDVKSEEEVRTAIEAHRSKGTTAMIASLVSMIDPVPVLEKLVPFCESGELLGIHMEGPYISPHKVGAQNPAAVRGADLDELRRWLEVGKGHIKTMTIAPEAENAVAAARLLLDYGAKPSWGHTSATTEETEGAIALTTAYANEIGFPSPAQTATHLFNAMPPLLHRAPGPVQALTAAARKGDAVVELVADTVHVDPRLVADVVEFVGAKGEPSSVVFVTDAMSGAGMADGAYVLGSLAVTIADGVARLTDGGAIAGGTSRLVEQIQKMVRGQYLSLAKAVESCVAGPAYALHLDGSEKGVTLEFTPGEAVNLVVLDDDLEFVTAMREGVIVGGE
ncbi:N-acetylglucosamine-6-phosphate deacetylase [Arcanobacterium canis]